jgi:hypothetical protein
MEKIGFGKQPYLVYEHTDAGHPHLHIVTTNIKADGKRIELHNLGRNQSEKARKEIELSFGLVQAENKQLKQVHELKPLNAQKLQYGKSDTRRAITNVLDVVLNKYKYTSLPELNAVLKLYNVVADQGSEDSRTYKHKGLVYRILDEQGNKVGVPIKASLIYSKPILSYIEGKFQQNETERQPHRQRLKTAIDWALLKPNQSSLPTFIKALEKESIHTVLRQNKEGIIYGITYIDHKTKCVFNGSDLGKPYSAKGILERCNQANTQQQAQGIGLQTLPTAKEGKNIRPVNNNTFQSTTNETDKILDSLVSPTTVYDGLPAELKTTKKKKKRKRISI